MRLIKEPLEIDFEVENRPLTREEERQISAFIKSDRQKIKAGKAGAKKLSKKEAGQKA